MQAILSGFRRAGDPNAVEPLGHRRFLQRSVWISMWLAVCYGAQAQSIAPDGCPIFHCTVEATGVIYQPLIPAVSTITSSSSLGNLQKQGCSGDGTTLACLFSTDNATGSAQGTLKLLDATTLQPIWGSAGSAYNLNAPSASDGQVPVVFSDGSIAAGDSHYLVRYSSQGVVIGKLSLRGNDLDYGLTPISATYGVVSQANAVLTLVDLSTWTNAGTLQLLDPATNGSLQLISPSSGAPNVLYAIAQNKINGNGYLFSIVINPATNRLEVSSSFEFTGQSGASPVVVTPGTSGLSTNLILLHVPGLIGDTQPKNRLLGLSDSAPGLNILWEIPLSAPLIVSPTVDQGSMSLFYHQQYNPVIYQNQLSTGTEIRSFNLQTIAGLPSPLQLNAHLGATQAGSVFTLLLGGAHSSAPGVGATYVMAFQPMVSPKSLLWSRQISNVPASYLAAWNFGPSSEAGILCPIAITAYTVGNSAIVRLCDF